MMSANGEDVYMEDVAAGVARRGSWRGKSRMVPMVLLSALLMVTGAAGAQAAIPVGNVAAVPYQGHKQSADVCGTVDITKFRTKLEINLTDQIGKKHKFTGYTDGGVIPGIFNFKLSGVLYTDDIQKLFYETNLFTYTHNDGVVTLNFLSDPKFKLGYVSLKKKISSSNGELTPRMEDKLPLLLPYRGNGMGKWERVI